MILSGLFEIVKELIDESTTPENPTTADLFNELAQRGRFDKDGGELSDEDWADSQ